MTSSRTLSRPERRAIALLDEHEITKFHIPVERLAQACGARVHFVEAPDDVSGALIEERGQLIIGVNDAHHPNRQRFTVAHELGHLLLHRENLQQSLFVDDALVYFRDDRSSKATDSREIQANQFAAALLMPRHLLLDVLSARGLDLYDERAVRALARLCKVSVQALTLRLASMGLIDGLDG